MKSLFTLFGISLLFNSCLPESNNKHLSYKNIIILSDMSDRILNEDFPQKDIKEIHKIINFFESECVKPGEKIGDKSSICFSPLSQNNIISVDIDKIKELGDKQSYINSTGKYKNRGLKKDLLEFEKSIAEKYMNINDKGLDLLSILLEKVKNENIIKTDRIITNGIDSTFIHYENDIYIFTDGYLEYSLKANNNQFRFGCTKINQIRKYCKNNKISVEEALNQNPELGLLPVKNGLHRNIQIHVVETFERGFKKKTQNYDYEVGFRDNEILKIVWDKWIIESGFKKPIWRTYNEGIYFKK